eukprot:3405223-Rhodomonas_salina.3
MRRASGAGIHGRRTRPALRPRAADPCRCCALLPRQTPRLRDGARGAAVRDALRAHGRRARHAESARERLAAARLRERGVRAGGQPACAAARGVRPRALAAAAPLAERCARRLLALAPVAAAGGVHAVGRGPVLCRGEARQPAQRPAAGAERSAGTVRVRCAAGGPTGHCRGRGVPALPCSGGAARLGVPPHARQRVRPGARGRGQLLPCLRDPVCARGLHRARAARRGGLRAARGRAGVAAAGGRRGAVRLPAAAAAAGARAPRQLEHRLDGGRPCAALPGHALCPGADAGTRLFRLLPRARRGRHPPRHGAGAGRRVRRGPSRADDGHAGPGGGVLLAAEADAPPLRVAGNAGRRVERGHPARGGHGAHGVRDIAQRRCYQRSASSSSVALQLRTALAMTIAQRWALSKVMHAKCTGDCMLSAARLAIGAFSGANCVASRMNTSVAAMVARVATAARLSAASSHATNAVLCKRKQYATVSHTNTSSTVLQTADRQTTNMFRLRRAKRWAQASCGPENTLPATSTAVKQPHAKSIPDCEKVTLPAPVTQTSRCERITSSEQLVCM